MTHRQSHHTKNKNPAESPFHKTLKELRREGVTSRHYARLLHALITHKQHNGTLTRGR